MKKSAYESKLSDLSDEDLATERVTNYEAVFDAADEGIEIFYEERLAACQAEEFRRQQERMSR